MEAGDRASWACGPSDMPGSFPTAHHQNDGTVYASCGIQGYGGCSPASASLSEQDRNSLGAYADMEFRTSGGRTVSGALRFERYTDAGSSLTGKLPGRAEVGASGAAVFHGLPCPSPSAAGLQHDRLRGWQRGSGEHGIPAGTR